MLDCPFLRFASVGSNPRSSQTSFPPRQARTGKIASNTSLFSLPYFFQKSNLELVFFSFEFPLTHLSRRRKQQIRRRIQCCLNRILYNTDDKSNRYYLICNRIRNTEQ